MLLENICRICKTSDRGLLYKIDSEFIHLLLRFRRVDRNKVGEIPLKFFDGIGDTITRRMSVNRAPYCG